MTLTRGGQTTYRQIMSLIRQNTPVDEDSMLIRTLGLKLSNSHLISGHEHSWGQIIFASHGVMQVDACGSRWVVPPMQCLWMPPSVTHSIRIIASTWMRTLYIRPDIAVRLSRDCKVLNVSPLLRELILEIVRLGMLSEKIPAHSHMTEVLVDQAITADEMSMKIKMPTDPRALRLADIISADPANKSALNGLAKMAGASPRTLERLFLQETGLSVGRWRQQTRLMMAVRLLVKGTCVNQVAFDSGYETPSAFVAMFRREIGITPGQYLKNLQSE
jgi:AraC-like DNA-binding protein